MNKKILSYEDAVKDLKLLEDVQRASKKSRKKTYANIEIKKNIHKHFLNRKEHINLLLSVIAAHKVARRLYGELQDVGRKLGV